MEFNAKCTACELNDKGTYTNSLSAWDIPSPHFSIFIKVTVQHPMKVGGHYLVTIKESE